MLFYTAITLTRSMFGDGLGKKRSTRICIFDRIMDKMLHMDIWDQTLLPFIESVYPDVNNAKTNELVISL